MEIELKDFVAESLKQIIEGVIAAQKHSEDKNAKIAPQGIYNTSSEHIRGTGIIGVGDEYINVIDFDIAVTAMEGAKSKSGVGVMVTVIGAGVQGQTEASNSTVSRIKFSIPVKLPRQ